MARVVEACVSKCQGMPTRHDHVGDRTVKGMHDGVIGRKYLMDVELAGDVDLDLSPDGTFSEVAWYDMIQGWD